MLFANAGPGSSRRSYVLLINAPPAGAHDAVHPSEVEATVRRATEGLGVDGKDYESRRCPVSEGVHVLKGTTPFGVVAYGYGPAGSYAFPGGADVEPIYVPPQ